jgi:hypothetical protein
MLDQGYYCFLEARSLMFHAPSPVGRCDRKGAYFQLRNVNRTCLRYWPFPLSIAKIIVNILHSFRLMVRYRYGSLPIEVVTALIRDILELPGRRSPVKRSTLNLFLRLQRKPMRTLPVP